MNLFGLQLFPKVSGTKKYYNAVGDEALLKDAARKLKAQVKEDKRGQHLDLTKKQAEKAKSLGAKETSERWW